MDGCGWIQIMDGWMDTNKDVDGYPDVRITKKMDGVDGNKWMKFSNPMCVRMANQI
jgi:hypothetical protein